MKIEKRIYKKQLHRLICKKLSDTQYITVDFKVDNKLEEITEYFIGTNEIRHLYLPFRKYTKETLNLIEEYEKYRR